MLAVSGGLLGVLLAWVFIDAAPTILPSGSGSGRRAAGDQPIVLLFTAGITLATGVLFGLVPADLRGPEQAPTDAQGFGPEFHGRTHAALVSRRHGGV